jgi:hypothetical protein
MHVLMDAWRTRRMRVLVFGLVALSCLAAVAAPNVVVNYAPGQAAAHGGYTTHGWQATVYPGRYGLGVLHVVPNRPVNPDDWRLSVNGHLFAPLDADDDHFEGLSLSGPGLYFGGLPLPNDAAPFDYRWEDWPSAIRQSAYERQHTYLEFRGQALALPSVLDVDHPG